MKRRALPVHRASLSGFRSNSLQIWVMLLMLCTPTIPFFLFGLKLTPLRIVTICLMLPALSILASENRRLIVADLFACSLGIWMISATLVADGFQTSAFIEAIEFIGAYFIGRAYVFGPLAQKTFVRALTLLIVVIVAIAVTDSISNRYTILETISNVLPTTGLPNTYRFGTVRAVSTFDGSHWLGTFSAVTAAVFLFSQRTLLNRIIFVGVSFLGCVLALSSSPLMAILIVILTYCYDRMLAGVFWKWKILIVLIALAYLALSVISDNPFASIIAHLTFDPSSGWYRMNTWDHATDNIALAPWFGYGFRTFGDLEDYWDQASVDCVYLVLALRFGLPAVAFLILTNVLSFSQFGAAFSGRKVNLYMDRLGTAFTLALVVFMFVGLTIHFWNAPWSMWGFLVGVRGSLKEYYLQSAKVKIDQRAVLVRSDQAFQNA